MILQMQMQAARLNLIATFLQSKSYKMHLLHYREMLHNSISHGHSFYNSFVVTIIIILGTTKTQGQVFVLTV